MKKIVFLSLFTLCLPLAMMAQSNDDDLYFIPSKDKDKEVKSPAKKAPAKREVTTIYTAPGSTVVVKDRKGNTRDVDEYNRRYDSRDNEFAMEDDTLYIKEKAQPGLEGEWVNGEFNGSQDDYEYAERIIRFRNPRYAISISSPFYWDVMYGANSWDWNVYSDGLYAYAFPTFSNRLWWNWRYSSYGNWGWGFGSPYYGYGWGGYYPGYWGGGYWGGHWGHHHHGGGYYPGWGGGGHWNSNRTYTSRRSSGSFDSSRRSGSSFGRQEAGAIRRSSGSASNGRVVGTRVPTSTRSSSARTFDGTSTRSGGSRPGVSTGTDIGGSRDGSTRRSTYTRPSSTRMSTDAIQRQSVRSSSEATRSYNRGSSDSPIRRSSPESTRRSYDNSSSTRSYSPVNSGSSRSSGSYSGGGGSSSRSSGGGGSSRSGGSRR